MIEQNDQLSIEKMLNLAMGLSMASLFAQAMGSTIRTLNQAVQSPTNMQPPRYIYAIIQGKQVGPLSLGEFYEQIRMKTITPDTYIWKVGMLEWRLARDVEDLSPSLETPPPSIETLNLDK